MLGLPELLQLIGLLNLLHLEFDIGWLFVIEEIVAVVVFVVGLVLGEVAVCLFAENQVLGGRELAGPAEHGQIRAVTAEHLFIDRYHA